MSNTVLPTRRYAGAGISRHRIFRVSVCVCLSVTRQFCIKTAKRRSTQTTPRDSKGIKVAGDDEFMRCGSSKRKESRSHRERQNGLEEVDEKRGRYMLNTCR